ncbi:MAG TPA: GNAT family N-acetyltransferase [Rheinheimera sp.]|nr:GNAT family N-acetyltransferase [Rheinheimera sp.]
MLLLDAKLFDFTWQDLHIKPLCEDDLQLYVDLYRNEKVMRFIGPPLLEEEAVASFGHALLFSKTPEGNRLFLTVRRRADSSPAGIVSISHLDRKKQMVELGSMLLPKFHGKLIGKESVIALMTQIKRTLSIHSFLLDIDLQNLPALRAARIMGFKPLQRNSKLHMINEII